MNSTPFVPSAELPAVIDLRGRLADLLTESRERTMELIAPLPVDELFMQQDPLMSPIIWDVGHIGNFEELWLVRGFGGSLGAGYDAMYDAMKNPRSTRDRLPLPAYEQLLAYLGDVRAAALDYLATADLEGNDPLLRDEI